MALIIKKNEPKPPRIIVYGGPGVGKTTFAASADSPIFIQTEDGLGQLEVDHFPLVTTYAEILEQITYLVENDHQYKTVVLDSIDWLENIIWAKVAEDQGKKSVEEIGYAKGYIFALEYWKEVLNGLNWLRVNKSMTPILIAHSQIKTFQSPTTEPYDRYSLKLHPKASAVCEEWSDAILYAGFKTVIKGDKSKGEHVRGIGKGERILYTEERPGFSAKNRYNLPPELPFAWEHFIEAVCPA